MSRTADRHQIEWFLNPTEWKSLGPLDLIPLLDQGQQCMNRELITYGIVEGTGKRTMRDACMPAESCAHYYAMTGDEASLDAVKAGVKAFRTYRHKARGRRIPYEGIGSPGVKVDATIEYEMISCHVGRNMRGMRAAAHVLRDERLLHEAAEELNWWIDNPLGFNKEKHFFDARIFVDEHGNNTGSEQKYTMNMAGSLACAMWLVGNDIGDRRLMDYAEDQILNGLPPLQHESGYCPYSMCHEYEIVDGMALDTNHYHGLTLQVLSPLLAYDFWRNQPVFVQLLRRGAKYVRDKMTFDTGIVKHPPHIAAIRAKKLGRSPKLPFGSTVNSALVHTRMYKYLGDEETMTQAAKNLRWLYWNSPGCVPFYTHSFFDFREVVLMAWEGMHLKQIGIRDVEPVLMQGEKK